MVYKTILTQSRNTCTAPQTWPDQWPLTSEPGCCPCHCRHGELRLGRGHPGQQGDRPAEQKGLQEEREGGQAAAAGDRWGVTTTGIVNKNTVDPKFTYQHLAFLIHRAETPFEIHLTRVSLLWLFRRERQVYNTETNENHRKCKQKYWGLDRWREKGSNQYY